MLLLKEMTETYIILLILFRKTSKLQLNFEFNALYSRNCICLTTIILDFFVYSNDTIFRIFG